MMQISIIIVNYNAAQLLVPCLRSIGKALTNIIGEVFVVDNSSTDGVGVEGLDTLFPAVRFITNAANVGFSKANNQVLPLCRGDHILFLNPDTIVPADALEKCIRFMADHPDAGALGVRMMNGEGHYLPESKRGFPSPLVSFWKLSGLIKLAPRSKVFARYYLGHLSESQTHVVDVLSGAFMLVRKNILDNIGGFDERFFMYAEDIDLSHRISRAGYKNYYFAGTTIIHLKGGSTVRNIAYTRQFYKAMSQFVKKYYGRGLYSALLDAAIWLRALPDVMSRMMSNKKG